MPASIQHEGGNLFQVRISGVLRQAELKDVQAVAAQEIARVGKVKLLLFYFFHPTDFPES